MIETKERLKDILTTGRIAELYANTYDSLINRIYDDGCIPESVSGGYGLVEFCRTIGGMHALLLQTGEYALAEKTIRFTLDSALRCGLNRIPHIAYRPQVHESGKITQEYSTDDQVDTTLHVLNAWARLVLTGKGTQALEDDYYDFVKKILNIIFDQPYFYYNDVPSDVYLNMFPPESLKLVFNCAIEHSRENRRWSAFDILTQSFAGAALEAMIPIARKRGDDKTAQYWAERQQLLRQGIDRYLTCEKDGKKLYMEMRIPDGGWGRPFTGMGWLMLSPVAAGWEALEPEVFDNTVEYVRKKLWMKAPFTDGKYYMATEFDEEGAINPNILGKVIGWDIVYCLRKGDYQRILDWLEFLEEVNTTELMAENLVPEGGKWLIADAGNGEQCTWWCWGMACLRENLGLSAAPERKKHVL